MFNKLKNISAYLIIIFVAFYTLFIPTSNATTDSNAVTTQNNETENTVSPSNEATTISKDETENSSATNSQDIHEGDLYLSGNEVTMDKLVNGNVYIFANNVTIKGQIAGNLIVAANTVTLEETYIQASAYIVAKEVKFNAVASDLYTACQTLTIDNKAGVYRDLNVSASKITLTGIIGRNANIGCNNLILTNGSNTAQIYGNLTHYSSQKIEIPEGAVTGNYDFKEVVKQTSETNFSDYIFSLLSFLVTIILIWGVIKLFASKFYDNSLGLASNKIVKIISIGVAWLILLPIASIILLCTGIGISAFLLLLGIYLLTLFISIPITSISVGNIINNKLNKKTTAMEFVCVIVSGMLFWVANLIPYISTIVLFASIIIGPGFMLYQLLEKNNKFKKALSNVETKNAK